MRKKLRQLRKDRGISQTFLAKKLGFKYTSGYSNIEYGTNRLSYEQALTIAAVFNIDVNELTEDETSFFEQKLHDTSNKQTA
jgi:transcriptional regulator with XRE-family HTH domain